MDGFAMVLGGALALLLGIVFMLISMVLALHERVNELNAQLAWLSSQRTTAGSGCGGLIGPVILVLLGVVLIALALGG